MKKKLNIIFISVCNLAYLNFINANTNLSTINIYQNSPQLDSRGYNNCDMKTNGELHIISKLIKNNDIIFDIGANIGEWTKLVTSQISPKKIYLFEPIPNIFKVLAKNIIHHNASLYNLAISNDLGEKTFFYYNNNTELSQLSTFHQRDSAIEHRLELHAEQIIVNTLTLDQFCINNQISHVDFVKIDTEGHELAILQGAQKLLARNVLKIIQFEYGGCYKDANTTLREVYELLTQYEYQIFRIIPTGLIKIKPWKDNLENYQYSNYLAIRK